ncbi:thioredoxin family protein [Macrococcus carouselicus]|uniref:Thioredoxin family protein n=1 Tax=Macrococcus carouselicus TaxID=69969 RepID=A0A9Q8CJE1_9STAP|nr:thioredoxin family protein [Macrococcus carouselicus]TDM00679.1 thioredoxin family protein [Macrococcus carouselicus]
MLSLKEYFENALSAEDYKAQMQVNKEEMQQIYDQFEAPEDQRIDEVKKRKLRVIAISEDWCGDAMMNNAILLKFAEKADMEVRFVLRDSHLDLIDQYLTNGTSRSIPIYVFIDENFEEQAVWGPRAEEVQAFIEDSRKDLPSKEDPSFEAKSKEKYQLAHDKFLSSPEFWNGVYYSMLNRLTK